MRDTEFFAKALGLEKPWQVGSVKMDMAGKRVEVEVECGTGTVWALEGERLHIHGYEMRQWRHLDTMQFETIIKARVPRVKHPDGRTEMVSVPWADARSRFTLLLEVWAVEVIQASRSLTQASELLRMSWSQVQAIMERAVSRGMERRSVEELRHVGMDEKSFGSGQSYISLMTDLEGGRVLEVMEGRDRSAADMLWASLPDEQLEKIEAVALDMAGYYVESAREAVPGAAIVHDKFHISKHLGEAVDKVRRAENKQLREEGEETLKGTRMLWLKGFEKMDADQQASFRRLKAMNLKVSRAWAIKELFKEFWYYYYPGSARRFFKKWFGWASRSKLRPVIAVARMLKNHLENMLTYMRHPITNAVTEGLNSKIQAIKSNARGFRSFFNYRTRILFFCGKLDLIPR